MYGRRCNAVIWNDVRNPARGDVVRTRFVACYICDDGYPTLDACRSAVPEPEKWAYVCFCGNWYAVNAQSYDRVIVVSEERIYKREAFDKHTSYAHGSDPLSSEDIRMHIIGPVYWVDGIYQDFMRIDPDLRVVRYNGRSYKDLLTVSNTVVALGIQFFATDICIRTDNYVDHVFGHYYSDRSMEYNYKKIRRLRERGIEYWNPFSGNTAVDEKDRNRQKKKREAGIDMGEIMEDRERIGFLKMMDESDVIATAAAEGFLYMRASNKRRRS